MKTFDLFVTFLLFLNGFTTAQTLIRDSCKKAAATDPELKLGFCVQSLEGDPQSKTATSLEGLVIASAKNAASKMINVKGIVENILKDKRASLGIEMLSVLRCCQCRAKAYYHRYLDIGGLKGIYYKWGPETNAFFITLYARLWMLLRGCVEFYDTAGDSIDEALTSVKSGDYDSAKVHLTAALDAPSDCEDGFMERKQHKSPFANENNVLSQKLSIPLDFTAML
ncbi:unnamed protein product [Microthlaspi erraticum]|uniref:Pectinesterase inhibitor domain-containing protein n=1 Tax=Microthlaspi erraticum TaxID=1685480 RepID=A0A6D2IUN8_9BRAS|nr:unnamed protein product [Microthlaspi erraticum]